MDYTIELYNNRLFTELEQVKGFVIASQYFKDNVGYLYEEDTISMVDYDRGINFIERNGLYLAYKLSRLVNPPNTIQHIELWIQKEYKKYCKKQNW